MPRLTGMVYFMLQLCKHKCQFKNIYIDCDLDKVLDWEFTVRIKLHPLYSELCWRHCGMKRNRWFNQQGYRNKDSSLSNPPGSVLD